MRPLMYMHTVTGMGYGAAPSTSRKAVAGPLTAVRITQVIETLRDTGIHALQLRGTDEDGSSRVREIDLLVPATPPSEITAVLEDLGYSRVPAWGHAPHLVYLAFEQSSGLWWKLDILTELRYGRPFKTLRMGSGEDFVARSVGEIPCPSDEFLALLFHVVLDKGEISDRNKRRLEDLWVSLQEDPRERTRAVALVEHYAGTTLAWSDVERAHACGWAGLTERRAELVAHLRSRAPIGTLALAVRARLLRRLAPALRGLTRKGRTVALLGPDGSGKTTLAQALEREAPLHARRLYMGTNAAEATTGSSWARRVRNERVRRRRAGAKAGAAIKVGDFLARVLEVHRRSGAAWYHVLRGRTVIYDRYPLPPADRGGMARRVRRRLLAGWAPTPDLYVVLDAPGEVLYARKGEHSPPVLDDMRGRLAKVVEGLPNVRRVDAGAKPDVVCHRVTGLIWSLYA